MINIPENNRGFLLSSGKWGSLILVTGLSRISGAKAAKVGLGLSSSDSYPKQSHWYASVISFLFQNSRKNTAGERKTMFKCPEHMQNTSVYEK